MGTLTNSARLINKIKNIKTTGVETTQPSNPVAGSMYYDQNDGTMKVYDGTEWKELGGGGGGGGGYICTYDNGNNTANTARPGNAKLAIVSTYHTSNPGTQRGGTAVTVAKDQIGPRHSIMCGNAVYTTVNNDGTCIYAYSSCANTQIAFFAAAGSGESKVAYLDVLVVGGGTQGADYRTNYIYGITGGLGGGVKECLCYPLTSEALAGGCFSLSVGGVGQSSTFGQVTASGGVIAISYNSPYGYVCSGNPKGCCSGRTDLPVKNGYAPAIYLNAGAGGYGTMPEFKDQGTDAAGCPCFSYTGSCGGPGVASDISGQQVYYGGGGGLGGKYTGYCSCRCGNYYFDEAPGCHGGGNGCAGSCNATQCGGGGGWYQGANGQAAPGVIILRYHTDGRDGIRNTSVGGCKYQCGDYTIHCFTTTGINYFIPVFK